MPTERDLPELSPEVEACLPELTETRRELHRHPELGLLERWTQAFVMERLAGLGLPHHPLAGTGVVASLETGAPGPALLVRADLDGLPILEQTGLPWASEHPGRMHACGHDFHVAMLLGAAELLAAHPPARGRITFCFQPAEETDSGARRMLAEGLLTEARPDAALAFHVWAGLPLGALALRPGAVMAAVDNFRLRVRGRGTHAALPELGVDPVLMAAQLVSAAQSIAARRTPRLSPVALSFTRVQGGTANNVIPEVVELEGTYRCLDPALRDFLWEELTRLGRGVCEGLGGWLEAERTSGLPVVVNDPAVCARLRPAAEALFGPRLLEPEPVLGGEDFGLILEKVPGAMLFLGCTPPGAGEVFPHHHPRFAPDERVLGLGLELWLRLIRAWLA
jgi:amidohydrolase